eukprot:6203707-Pleurochrysis_carterae.AAC.1
MAKEGSASAQDATTTDSDVNERRVDAMSQWLRDVMSLLARADEGDDTCAIAIPAIALGDFVAESDVELSIRIQERVLVLTGPSFVPPEGWAVAMRAKSGGEGESGGDAGGAGAGAGAGAAGGRSKGLVPSAYVQLLPVDVECAAEFEVRSGVVLRPGQRLRLLPERSIGDKWAVRVVREGENEGERALREGAGVGTEVFLLPKGAVRPCASDAVQSAAKQRLLEEAEAVERERVNREEEKRRKEEERRAEELRK